MKWNLYLILLINFIFTQPTSSMHIRELENHKYINIDFQSIDQELTLTAPFEKSRHILSHEIIGYLPYWEYENYSTLNYDLLTQINYFSAELTETGDISNTHGWPDLAMISFAQDMGVKVKLTATLFGSAQLTTLLSNNDYRQNSIDNLLSLVLTAGADGIDIDFELVPESQRENLVTFMSDLATEFRSNLPGAIITMASPAVDWWGSWDYEALANICDGLFVMGYDYHWNGSTTAGPVSPLGGFFFDVEYTIYDYLEITNGNSQKIILGVPYYGYDWPVLDESIYSQTLGNGIAKVYSTAKGMVETYGTVWDQNSNTHWISYNNSEFRQCWYDDSLSLSLKYQFAIDNNLAGVGMWALGYDIGNTELWDALEAHFSECENNGDINNDVSLDILDIILLINFILNIMEFDDFQNCVGDLNSDNNIDILDVINLMNNILEL